MFQQLHFTLRLSLVLSALLFNTGNQLSGKENADASSSSFTSEQRSKVSVWEGMPEAVKIDGHLLSELRPSLRDVYVWAWPMVYLNNVQKSLQLVRRHGVSGGAPVAPINSLCMLTEPVDAEFSSVPCPNRDVIYGFGMMDLTRCPVVVQVPEFQENQLWLYQLGDHRTDSFAELGSMYQTRAGFYLIVGPDWDGEVPEGIQGTFRSPTNLAYILPRILVTPENAQDEALLSHLAQIVMYPSSKYTGRIKTCDWTKRKWYPAIGETSREHCKLVRPSTFFEDLRAVLKVVPPLAGEEQLYESAQRIVKEYEQDPEFASMLNRVAVDIEKSEIVPFFHFQNVGTQLPGYWTSVANGAAFGNDYRTRTAVAKSNIFVNRSNEAKYFYLEQSCDGIPLTGNGNYEMKFAADALPPNDGFWSLTLYDEDHHLYANPWKIHSIGSADHASLKWNDDGSLTVVIGDKPTDSSAVNWIPAPPGRFVLYLRVYVPKEPVRNGDWYPPAATLIDANYQTPNHSLATFKPIEDLGGKVTSHPNTPRTQLK
jgi:hypothetical protein